MKWNEGESSTQKGIAIGAHAPCRSRRGGRVGGRGCRPVRGCVLRAAPGSGREARPRPEARAGRGSRRGRSATRPASREGAGSGSWWNWRVACLEYQPLGPPLGLTGSSSSGRKHIREPASWMAGWRQRDLGGAGAGFGGAGAGLGRRLAVAGAEGGGFLRFFCVFLFPFLSAVSGHARGRRPVSVWCARGKIASSAKTSGAEREKGKSS